jgi:hypothetical protein
MTDLPAVPPPGTSIVCNIPVLSAAGGPREMSGLVISGDGRLTIACNGAGLAVRLEAEDATALAILLWQIAGQLANAEQKAAAAADAALNRIFEERAGHA